MYVEEKTAKCSMLEHGLCIICAFLFVSCITVPLSYNFYWQYGPLHRKTHRASESSLKKETSQ